MCRGSHKAEDLKCFFCGSLYKTRCIHILYTMLAISCKHPTPVTAASAHYTSTSSSFYFSWQLVAPFSFKIASDCSFCSVYFSMVCISLCYFKFSTAILQSCALEFFKSVLTSGSYPSSLPSTFSLVMSIVCYTTPSSCQQCSLHAKFVMGMTNLYYLFFSVWSALLSKLGCFIVEFVDLKNSCLVECKACLSWTVVSRCTPRC